MVCDAANLSREFRALVTAIRGPLEDELADRSASAARRERLKTLHRNFMRLLQLVNALFDVAQSETGRRSGSDLVDLTAETVIIPTLRDGEPAAHGELSPLERDTPEGPSSTSAVVDDLLSPPEHQLP